MHRIHISRNAKAIIIGVVFLLIMRALVGIGLAFFSFEAVVWTSAGTTVSDYSPMPYETYLNLLSSFSYVYPLLGGLIVGLVAKEKRVSNAFLAALISVLVAIIAMLFLLIFVMLFPGKNQASIQAVGMYINSTIRNIARIVLTSPKIIIPSVIGGYVCELLPKRKTVPNR